jgi:PKD repeat protein
MGKKYNLFFGVISVILLSVTAFALPENDNYAKSTQAKQEINRESLVADFDITASFSTEPPTINFIDKSIGSPTSWSWDFGDKSTSIAQNPIHKYSEPGKYTVTLTVNKFTQIDTVKKIISFTGCDKYKSCYIAA